MKRTMDVVKYDTNWVKMFAIEKKLLTDIFKGNIAGIEHFGSTSVPGLSAKPIIDIIVLVYDINKIDQYNDVMKGYGYDVRGEHGIPGRKFFVRFKEDLVNHSHHTHIYEQVNPYTDDMLLFRDYLCINREACSRYENIKKELSGKYYTEPRAYTDGKRDCVMEILEEAKRYFSK